MILTLNKQNNIFNIVYFILILIFMYFIIHNIIILVLNKIWETFCQILIHQLILLIKISRPLLLWHSHVQIQILNLCVLPPQKNLWLYASVQLLFQTYTGLWIVYKWTYRASKDCWLYFWRLGDEYDIDSDLTRRRERPVI